MNKHLKAGQQVLLVVMDTDDTVNCVPLIRDIRKHIGESGNVVVDNNINIEKGSQKSTEFDIIISGYETPFFHNIELLKKYRNLLKPNGVLLFHEKFEETSEDDVNLEFVQHYSSRLKLTGFVVSRPEPGSGASLVTKVEARKPNYEQDLQVPLQISETNTITKPEESKKLWKLDTDDNNVLNEDNFVEPSDIPETPAFQLQECAPTNTNKRKACKNCTCGLAEIETKNAEVKEVPKSSCGNCYLGDAFRCSSCPYAGLPAFKPGEKVVIPSTD